MDGEKIYTGSDLENWAVRFFSSLRHTKGRFYGEKFELLPWQETIIRDVYGTVDERGRRKYKYIYVEVPKKNGKSELAAGAGLFHTFADREINGEVYGCAADRSQASIVFDVAVDMIDQIPFLKERTKLTLSQHKLMDKRSGTVYKVVSAEAYTKHGLNVSAVIFDELHAQPSRDLWDVMTFGAGDARTQPIWWIITTAGDDPDRVSIGWEQHEYARRILAGEIEDKTWYPVIYGYDPGDGEKPGAIYDEELWRRVNPSMGTTFTVESVREQAEKAKIRPADERLFRWLRLNQWITTKLSGWLPVDLFDQTVGDWSRADQLGKDVYLGLDLSTTTDLCALALVWPPQGNQLEWRVAWHCWIPRENMQERIEKDRVPYDRWEKAGWLTVTEGNVVDYTVIRETILEAQRFYKVIELDADRAFATMLIQELEQAGMVCVDVPQTFVSLTDAMNQTEVLLKGGGERDHERHEIHEKEKEQENNESDEKEQGDWRGEIKLIKGRMIQGRMTHEASPVARWCFGNTAIAQNGQGFIKFVKEHKGKSVLRTKRIDLVAAWINAMARARFYAGSVDISAQILDEDWGM